MVRRLLMSLAIALCLAGAVPLARPQAERSWLLEDFQVVLEVQLDGNLEVTETLRPRFVGSFNGIFRTIPVDYRTPEGFNYKLFVRLESATDAEGNTLRSETSREGHYLKCKIWIPGARDTTKTVLLRYRVENAVRYFPDHDELYWNATGSEWPVPIERASALIKLPAAAAGPELRAAAYTGPYGSMTSDADVEATGSQVAFRSRRSLGYREGLTVVAGWRKGVVGEPGVVTRGWRFLRANWFFFIPILVFLGMFRLWQTRGKDPRPEEAVMVRYDPPEKLTPGELGTLVDNKPDLRDLTATLIDLAVRGYIRIEEKEHKVFLWTTRDYAFHLIKPREEWGELKRHERNLLEAIFDARGVWAATGMTVNLSDLQNRFYRKLPGIRQALFQELITSRYYTKDPSKVRNFYLGLGFATLFLVTGGLAWLANVMGSSLLSAIIAGVLSGLIIIAFAFVMPARTLRGARVRLQVLGFEEFLSRAEKDHLARLASSPEMFDKYLPFAMALGVENRWARAFADIYRQPPNWYQGSYTHGFQPALLVNDLNAFTQSTASTFVSAPRSSSRSSEGSGFGSSGSSGFSGGFSGGGFGGGGGGAF